MMPAAGAMKVSRAVQQASKVEAIGPTHDPMRHGLTKQRSTGAKKSPTLQTQQITQLDEELAASRNGG